MGGGFSAFRAHCLAACSDRSHALRFFAHIPIFLKGLFCALIPLLPLHLRQCYCPWHAGRGSSVSFLFLCVMHTVRRECMRKLTPT